MRRVSSSGIAALAMVALSGPVAAGTLTFDGDICDGGNPCSNEAPIDQEYGDTPTVNVSYATLLAYGVPSESVGSLSFWGIGYSDLTNVVYPLQDSAVGQIAFVPLAGYSVTLSSFDLGSFSQGPINTGIYIYDASSTELWARAGFFGESTATTFEPNITSTGPLYLQWGTDFNVGLDNIVFSSALIDNPPDPDPDPNVIPLPAAGWLLLAGLGGLAALRRRR